MRGIKKLLRKGIPKQNSHISQGVLKQIYSEAYLWARRAANQFLSKAAEYAFGYYAVGNKQDIELTVLVSLIFCYVGITQALAQGNKPAMN